MVIKLKKWKGWSSMKIIRSFRLLIICTLLASIILPAIAYDASLAQPLFISKTIPFLRLIIIALCLQLIFLIFRKDRIEIALTQLDLAIILLVFFIIINRYAIAPEYGFSVRFIEFLSLSVFYFVLRWVPKSYFGYLLLGITLIGCLQALYGMLQLFGYHSSMNSAFKMTGNFINPGPYGGFLAVTGICGLGLYLFKEELTSLVMKSKENGQISIINKVKEQFFSYLPLMGVGIILMVVPATQSRASWLAFLSGLIYLIVYKYSQVVFHLKERLFSLSRFTRLILIFSVSVIFSLGLYGLIHLKTASASGRLLVWKTSANIIKENPFTGTGYDRFQSHYMEAQAQYFKGNINTSEANLADNTMYAFNEPLQFLVENGLIGFILLLVLVTTLLSVKVPQKDNWLKILAISILISGFIFSLFSYPSQILPIKIVMVTAVALLARITSKNFVFTLPKTTWKGKNLMFKVFSVILILIFSGIIFYQISFTKKSYQHWQRALVIYNYGSYDESSAEFKKAMPVLHANGEFLMQYGKSLIMEGKNREGIRILTEAQIHLNNTVIQTSIGNAYKELKEFRKAEQAYIKAAFMAPNRFYPHYLLAKLYQVSNEPEKAKAKAREILNKPVKVPSPAIKEMKEEMKSIL